MFETIDTANSQAVTVSHVSRASRGSTVTLDSLATDKIEHVMTAADNICRVLQQITTMVAEGVVAASGCRRKQKMEKIGDADQIDSEAQELGPDAQEREYHRCISINNLKVDSIYAGIQVKREIVEESSANQAQLQSTVAAASDQILQIQTMLTECKEALECCICLERTVCNQHK